MRKLVLALAVSLDGFIEGPNGEYDWCTTPEDYDFGEFFQRIDTIFVGRKTYEMSASMEGGPPGFPSFKEYVFSKTLNQVKPGATLVKGDVKTEVERIKNEKGKDIWLFGGAILTSTLMNLKLVDELHLGVYPILLGRGKPLFQDIGERLKLKLIDSKTYSNGLVALKYSVMRS
jgi:dihydrofolate reductase